MIPTPTDPTPAKHRAVPVSHGPPRPDDAHVPCAQPLRGAVICPRIGGEISAQR